MKRNIGKIAILYIAISGLTACGVRGGTSLEDMQVSLLPDRVEEGQGDGGDPDSSGQEENSVSESGGQREGSLPDGQGTVDAAIGSTQETESMSGGQEQGEEPGSQGSSAQEIGFGETDPDRAAMMEAYITVLEDIYFDQIFPGGQDYGYQPGNPYDVASNQFAVYDIDRDGKEELIIVYTTTYTAGQGTMVYGYDSATGEVREELRTYPLVTYYENGVVEEQMSHNHGMAPDGDFWPYILYQYSENSDCYAEIASVDAWSKAYREEDYDGNPFPEDVDADGDGMVYYVTTGDDGLKNPMDGPAYHAWRDSCVKGTEQIRIPYVNLTPDQFYTLDRKESGIPENQTGDQADNLTSEAYAGYYSVCTSKIAWEVEHFARKVRALILEEDFAKLSELISYPIIVDGTSYQDRETFLKADFIEEPNPEFLEAIEEEPCREMFANWQGIMMGNGAVWIGEALNDDLSSQGLKVMSISGVTP